MRVYHLHTYNKENRLIGAPVLFRAANDDEAIAVASKITVDYVAELYEDQRLVHRFAEFVDKP